MPQSPYAKVIATVNAGSPTSGGLTVPAAAAITLAGENTTGWLNQLWEIYEYPSGWSAPAGWSTDGSGVIFSTAVTPPAFSLPAITLWGKFLLRLTVNGGILNGLYAGPGSPQPLIDIATAFSILSPLGLVDTAFGETNQFDAVRQWVAAMKANWRAIAASGSLRASVTKSANYTLLSTDGDAHAVLGGGSFTLKLPATPGTDEEHTIDDRDWVAATHNLTIDGNGNQVRRRDGTLGSTYTMAVNGESISYKWNGVNWGIR